MEIILYAIMVVMIIRIFLLNKKTKKSKKLISCVNSIGNEKEFFENVKTFEEEMKDDPEFLNKGRVIHLWGMAFHKHFLDFDAKMNEIDCSALMINKKNFVSISEDEDAFFYLYLGIPNILEKDEMPQYRRKLKEKMSEYDQVLNDQLVRALSEEINKFYENEDDRGLAFYEKLLEGDYKDYEYSKSLVGLYKSIANAHAAKIYQDQGNTEKYEECVPMLENFAESGIGERWIKGLGLEVKKKEDESEVFDVEDTDEEEINEEEKEEKEEE